MKQIIITSLAILMLFSCAKDKESDTQQFPQSWTLVKMIGHWAGTELTGEDMDFQEDYAFNSDFTFIKTRVQGPTTIMATGSFTYSEINDIEKLELTFVSGVEIIETCYGPNTERFEYESNTSLIGTGHHCDGLELFYHQN